ncbi:MAG: 50S ribosomal protein L1 [Deltaproteobacteria bacterium]|nr:50S ribosomal protein L1 [Deltaproteobacteria bacterium]MBI4224230.1 50S ribosomal protein L1 [Deltaproteobacteria bacterium]
MKRYQKNSEKIELGKRYTLSEAVTRLAQMEGAKFDETVDLSIRLGVDPTQADQNVRGTVPLPHGTGKNIRVAVFAKGEKAAEAKEAGADVVGEKDLAEKIEKGFLDFDKTVATPDLMGLVGKLGRVLGPRGLMPNPKLGTVTMEVGVAVKQLKAGMIEFRIDKNGIIHTLAGKKSFAPEKLQENIRALLEAVVRAKPAAAKGHYLRSITVSSTMGPGIGIDPGEFMKG